MKTILFVISFIATSTALVAHNNLFLPGDAFFSARFDEDLFDKQKDSKRLDLPYHRFYGKFMACGYAGYENLAVGAISPKVAENLRKVHTKLFKEFRNGALKAPLDKNAKPYFPLLVYNRNYPLAYPIGLKYNEDWAKDQVEDAGKGHAIYDDIGDTNLLIADWASADEISPLAIDMDRPPYPEKTEEGGGVVREPVESAAEGLKFVILAGDDILRFAQRKAGLTFFVVSEKIQRYQFDKNGTAIAVPFEAKADDYAARIKQIEDDRKAIRAALDIYRLNTGSKVPEKQGLKALVEKPAGAKNWLQTLAKLPKDPWGNPYDFNGHEITSRGPDGKKETDDDILW